MLKKLLLFILLFGTVYLKAQTYYWVGGSGYWNDATHWSYTSGGISVAAIFKVKYLLDNGKLKV